MKVMVYILIISLCHVMTFMLVILVFHVSYTNVQDISKLA